LNSTRWLLIGSALVALLVGFYASNRLNNEPDTAPADITFEELVLPDLSGGMQPLDKWNGKLLLINFWATWCPPCIEEIPLFMRLRERYADRGFEVIGIAIDDEQKVRNFQDQHSINYPVLLGGDNGISLMQRFNNRLGALPFSVLFNPQGKAVHFKPGAYSEQELEALINKHI
jgi:thiol-disulfide isomerase/thioredoxin